MEKEYAFRLPRLISDGMVLRSGERTNIWGYASPGDRIEILFLGEKKEVVTDESGGWRTAFDDLKPGGPYEMVISCESGESIRLTDILIGEVWLCSGQSNMELPISRVIDHYPQLKNSLDNHHIREFKVSEKYCFHGPLEELESGSWQPAKGEAVMNISALAYFFASYLYEAASIPVGIINASLGGSPIQAWLKEELLSDWEEYEQEMTACKEDWYIEERIGENLNLSEEWYNSLAKLDSGLIGRSRCNQDSTNFLNATGRELPWFDKDLPEEEWKEIGIPGFFADEGLGDFTGSLWFRKKVFLKEYQVSGRIRLNLGTIVDSDEVYVNGVFVGSTAYQYPPRKYTIPEGVLRAGENVIAIRVICDKGSGRFTPGKSYELITGEEKISLEGRWKYRIGAVCKEKPQTVFISWKPSGLYNGMLAPCHKYSITGALWYQGESNTETPDNYGELLRRLINSWREDWGQGDFPFLIVQLPNFEIDIPSGDIGWPKVREAQRQALELLNTALIVTLDLGEDNDIHPLEKREIACRLSLGARALARKEELEYSGPSIIKAEQQGEEIVLTFSHAQSGLRTESGSLHPGNFLVAGKDRICKRAAAEISGSQILLRVEQQCELVCYACSNSPKEALLYNREGLPASPFIIKVIQNNEIE